MNEFWGGFGAGSGADLGKTADILVPEITFQTNDAWPIVRGTANGRGAPLLLMDHYSKGILFVLVLPENANDLYALPQPVLTAIRRYIQSGFPFILDAPGKVSLLAYDNNSFVVESFLDAPADITVNAAGTSSKLHNLTSGEEVDGKPLAIPHGRRTAPISAFHITLQPHSFLAFTAEQ